MAATDPTAPEPRRFSIRLPRPLWIGLAAVALSAVAVGLQVGVPIYRQRAAVREIQRLGGEVTRQSGRAQWLCRFVRDGKTEIFDDVVEVRFRPDVATFVKRFHSPPHIGGVPWADGPTIDDEHLVCIRGLQHMKRLDLNWTNVSDAGVRHIYRLRNLEELSLAGTDVSDATILDLKRELPRLAVRR